MTISISPSGAMSFIYDDDLRGLLDEGNASIKRASHVEPMADTSDWTADLAPVGGPVLGPFTKRREALEAERDWIAENTL
jgi:hypothetical protein